MFIKYNVYNLKTYNSMFICTNWHKNYNKANHIKSFINGHCVC